METSPLQELQFPSQHGAGGTQQKGRRDFFHCDTASNFSHFRFFPTNSTHDELFPHYQESVFQHLAGMFRTWAPFPHNPGRGKALWAVLLAGGKVAGGRLHTILTWRKQSTLTCTGTSGEASWFEIKQNQAARDKQEVPTRADVFEAFEVFGHTGWPRTG